jgi:hypothetical protein
MSEAKLQELRDRKAIRELKARYWRTLDAKDWVAFREQFADDATFQLMDEEPIRGADAFVAWTSRNLEGTKTVHQGHMPEISIDSPTEARALWNLYDYVEWPPDPATGERRGIEGYGRYRETYRKIDGEWKMTTWHLSYLRMDPLPREPLPDQALGGPDVLREGHYDETAHPAV